MGSLGHNKHSVNKDDIEQLRQLLAGTQAKVLSPTNDGYEKSIDRWSKAAEKPAGVAIVPTTAKDVSIAIKYVTKLGLPLPHRGRSPRPVQNGG